MKYLEDDKLTLWTSELTDAVLAGRVINGRIEAFTMKRAGTDKKYAHALGEKFVAEMEQRESEMADYQEFLQKQKLRNQRSADARKRSVSYGSSPTIETEKPVKLQRTRANSLDESVAAGLSIPALSPLGDFQEIGTRRLMTDLILTLNASFPDYDFGNSRPFHFIKRVLKVPWTKPMVVCRSWRLEEARTFYEKCGTRLTMSFACRKPRSSYVPPAINEDLWDS
ncbi:RNA polymerase III core binding protein [Fragilaria crotonensis]|nr:RNA polymerase III core binding protein [Fragilaria crotonensis]